MPNCEISQHQSNYNTWMFFDAHLLCDVSVFRSMHLGKRKRSRTTVAVPRRRSDTRGKRWSFVRKKRWRRGGRGKNEIRSGPTPAFAFKLLYNCILRGTKSDGDLRDVITDERLYKKLPILSSLSPVPVGRALLHPHVSTDFSFSPFRPPSRPALPPANAPAPRRNSFLPWVEVADERVNRKNGESRVCKNEWGGGGG